MTKFILLMLICSGIPGNECKPMATPFYEFETYSQCILYGYDISGEILRAMGQDFVEEHKAFTVFDCEESTTI
jgi:hypothetical protein